MSAAASTKLRVASQPMDEAQPMKGLALRREAAAAVLGVSTKTFDRHVRPHLRVVHLGTTRVYPVAAIEAFLDERASAPMGDVAA